MPRDFQQVLALANPVGETRDVLQGTDAAFTPQHHHCDVTLAIRAFDDDASVSFSIDGGETWLIEHGFVQGVTGAGNPASGGFPRLNYDQCLMITGVPPNSRLMLNIASKSASKIIYAILVTHCREIGD